MEWRNDTRRYGSPAIGLHWLTLVLLVAVYALMELHDLAPRGSALRSGMKHWHYILGLTVLALTGFRLAVRWSGPTPAITPPPPAWQMLAARVVHLGLYALLAGMPLIGWAILSGEGDPIPFWGIELPPIPGVTEAFADELEEWHEIGATLGYWLIGLHAAAGLLHHYLSRDDTLRRMLPGR